MSWNNLSMRSKLFVAFAVTASLVIFIIVGMVAWSMRSGFTQYLLNAEAEKMDPIVAALSEDYDESSGSWPQFTAGFGSWIGYSRNVLEEFAIKHNFPGAGRPVNDDAPQMKPHPRGRDPLQLGPRLFLYDRNKKQIAGLPTSNEGALYLPIKLNSGASRGTIVGYLGLRPPLQDNQIADHTYLMTQVRTLMWASVFALIASAVAAFLLSRQLATPLRRLASSTRILANGDYSERLQSTRKDEIGQLIADFNALADSLERTSKAEQQWISDTSHELKTPLSVLRAEIEALQDGVRQAGEGAYSTLHSAVMRMSDLIQTLSMLSYAREGKLVHPIQNQNLSELIGDVAASSRGIVEDSGLTLVEDIQPDVIGSIDPNRLQQLIGNFLENSRRYTNPPGAVSVSLMKQGSSALIIVEDAAPSPPESALEHLFDRFYRVEESRSRASGGAGLGLAICSAIVEGHGGTITGEISKLGGLLITVRIPLEEAISSAS